jgi:hypothetical protein
MKFKDLKARYEVLVSDKASIVEVFALIEQFILPYRAYFNGTVESSNQIRWRRPELYDSTAVISAHNLAANLHSNLTNPVLQWFNILTKDKRLNRTNEVKVWLEECTDLIYQVLQASNFELQVNEAYIDIVGFGTSIVIEEVREIQGKLHSLQFTTIPIEECVFETDHAERLSGLFRKLNWTPAQIISKFGLDNVPQSVVDDNGNAQKCNVRRPVLFCITRRWEIDEEWAAQHRVLPPKSRPWAATYHLYDTGDLLEESGYYEMPAFAPRWRKASGSVWGFSPSMLCLSDVMTLNKMVELGLKVAEKSLDPPAIASRRGIHGDINLQAGGVTIVGDTNADLRYLDYKGRFDIHSVTKEDLTRAIEKAYYTDQLQLKESPAMTATEVQVRYQLMQRLLGPSLGRLQNDFLDPLIERTFRILYRYGLVPQAPPSVARSGVDFEIEYVGPMARSQRFDTVASIERWIQNVINLANVTPEALDVPNFDEVVKEMGYSAGVPAKLVKSDSLIILERAKRAKQQEQMMQMQMAQGAGEAARSFGQGAEAMSKAQQGA